MCIKAVLSRYLPVLSLVGTVNFVDSRRIRLEKPFLLDDEVQRNPKIVAEDSVSAVKTRPLTVNRKARKC